MSKIEKISSCLWFDSDAEEAALHYTRIFKNSSVDKITHYTEAGMETHRMKPGSVMTVDFTLQGQKFTALNGGPIFKFNEAVSFVVNCKDQEEVDYYWNELSAGGDRKAQQCGWLKDKFGLSWQVVPVQLAELINDSDKEKAKKVMTVFMKMKKINIEELMAASK